MKASTGFSDLSKKMEWNGSLKISEKQGQQHLPRFLVDCMLGRLARWLRILGFDALYVRSISDRDLLVNLKDTSRILLTRDTGLIRSKNIGPYVLIGEDNWEAQIRQVLDVFSLTVCRARLFTRCTLCNERLRVLSRNEVQGKVPDFVASTQREFRGCDACGRIYWSGTHRRHVSRTLARLGAGERRGWP